MDTQRLFDIVDSYREDILSTLRRWIRVPSVGGERSAENAPFGDGVRRMLDTALQDAADMGFETREFDDYAMHAQLGHGDETMGMLCHLDVVPAGDGWTRDPWGGEIADGRIYGRGTADDKGCAVLALYAMKAVREAGIPLKDSVRLILGCDEETGMTDMRHYASCVKMPDYGFSPDAEFPVINTEKGGVNLRLTAESAGEAGAEIAVHELYAGERPNVVPGLALAVLSVKDAERFEKDFARVTAETGFDVKCEKRADGKYTLTAKGQSAHASMPHLGKNAAGMLLILLSRLNAGGGIRAAIAALADKLGLEGDGKSLGIACADEESGALTCNLGILRFDGRVLSAVLDIRAPMCADYTLLCGQAVSALAGTGVGVYMASSRPPYHVDKDHRVVRNLIDAYSEVTGEPGYAFAIGGGTYSRCMPNTVAFGPNFPGDPDMCHMPDEFMDIGKLIKSCKIYALAIAKLAGRRFSRSIAIDGPCGAGKSTVAVEAARRLGGNYLDTGAMYRAVGVYMLDAGVDPADASEVLAHAENACVDVKYTPEGEQHTYLNGVDVTARLRTPEVSRAASAVATVKRVRELMVKRQKELASEMFLVCDGRDIGTCVITDAALKIYLTADAEERARRRFNQMEDKSCGFEAVLRDINARDYNDMHREESPLRKADDAVQLDTTHMTFDEVVQEVTRLYRERIKE